MALTSARTEHAYSRGLKSCIDDKSPYILSSVSYLDAWWRKGYKETHGVDQVEYQLSRDKPQL